MKPFLALVALIVGGLVLAAALNYPLYQFLSLFGDVRADRVLYRSAMLFVALGLWPLLGWLGLRNPAALGLHAPMGRHWSVEISRGFGAGVLILLVLSLALVWLDIRFFRPATDALWWKLGKLLITALVAGLLIAVIEEVFFRGAMFGGLRRSQPLWIAATLTALVYASLHFVRPAPAPEVMQWHSGFTMLAGSLSKYATPERYYDSFIALFAAGVLLALIRERSGNILFGLGMHAGWIYVIRFTRKATDVDYQAPAVFLIGHYDKVIGWLAAAWLALLSILYWRFSRRRS